MPTLEDLDRIYSQAWFQSYPYDSIEDAKQRRLERHRAGLAAVRTALFDGLIEQATRTGATVQIPDGRQDRLAAWLQRRRDRTENVDRTNDEVVGNGQ